MRFISPVSGQPLREDTPHSLADDNGQRWPVIDGIAYLRVGRDALIAETLAKLDDGDRDAAVAVLLADQDQWWTGPATEEADLLRLVRQSDEITLREAMALLRYGPVGDYFAHRWSDPTYLAGLALLEAHWDAPRTVFELASGIGHYARELTARGVACLCADIVFSKCWLARHWVAPEARYVVFDAGQNWPIAGRRFDCVHCQDAFYFLPEQRRVAAQIRAATEPAGFLAIGHLHNANVDGGSFGPARLAADWRDLFPTAHVYDEAALLSAMMKGVAPKPGEWADDPNVEAWSIVEGGGEARRIDGGLTLPTRDRALQANPLAGPDGPIWPSNRYEAEYGPRSTWTNPAPDSDPARDRRLVDLPERW